MRDEWYVKYCFGVSIQNTDIADAVGVKDQQLCGDVASDRRSSWYRMQSSRQVSENVELPRLTFSQPTIADSDVNVIGDMNEDVFLGGYENHSEVTSPLALPTRD